MNDKVRVTMMQVDKNGNLRVEQVEMTFGELQALKEVQEVSRIARQVARREAAEQEAGVLPAILVFEKLGQHSGEPVEEENDEEDFD